MAAMAKSRRHWAAIAVVLTWGGALTWLALRRTGQSDLSLIASQASLRLAPGDAWFRVMAGDVQIGYAGITLDTLADGSYRIRELLTLELPRDTALTRAIRSTEYFLGGTLGVDSLSSRFTRPGRQTEIRVRGDGPAWQLTSEGAGPPVSARLEVVDRGRAPAAIPVPLLVAPLRLALVGALAARDGRTMPMAGGWPPVAWSTTIVPDGDSTAVYADSSDVDPVTGEWTAVAWDTTETRALVIDAPDGPVRLVVGPRGTVVSIEHALGVRWLREDFSVARLNFRGALEAGRILAALPVMAWGSLRPAPGDTATTASNYAVTRRGGSPINANLMRLLAGGRQQVSSVGLVVLSRGAAPRPGTGPSHDPLIQDGDSAIAALHTELQPLIEAGNFRQVVRVLRARVAVDTALDLPEDAAGALRLGRARPEGLGRVLAAVLTRAGYRAHLVVGVQPAGDTLYTHAWIEASRRIDGWEQVLDPLTGQTPPTTWVRVAVAGSAAPEDLLPLVADVRFTLVTPPANEGAAP